jgi:uncharacterized protein (UPF0276 family)
MYSTLPYLGVGIGWRNEIATQILDNLDSIDWCEVISEHYLGVPDDHLAQVAGLAKRIPLVPHGVDLSIGTDGPLDEPYVLNLRKLVDAVDAPWFTDHLCFTRVPGYNLGQLAPLPFSEESVAVVAAHAKRVKEICPRPFLLENITYDFVVPGSTMSESEFITRVLLQADVGLLLDVTNLFINSQNHGYDVDTFLNAIPLDRVVQLHMAGGYHNGQKLVDSHSYPVPDSVFDLMAEIVERADVKGILLERDANYPAAFGELVDELARARALLERARSRRLVPVA